MAWLPDTHYIYAKFLAIFVRTAHSSLKLWRRYKPIGGYSADWEKAWGQWTKEYTIPSSISSRKIRIRVWSPPSPTGVHDAETSKILTPVHINFHGSGHLIRDDFGNDSDYCKYIATRLGITVLDCDYAKGPEYPYPHGITDAHDILHHVVSTQPPEYDLSHITVGGFSAGGGIAFGLAASEDPVARQYIRAVVGVYPWVNPSAQHPDPPEGREGSTAIRLETFPHFHAFVNAYAFPPFVINDPRLSPALLPDADLVQAFTKGEKKVFFLSGSRDNITPQVKTLAGRLESLGVDATFKEIKDVGHAWDKTHKSEGWEADRKAETYSMVADFLRGVDGISVP